jgi:serine/alanine adding enzyme
MNSQLEAQLKKLKTEKGIIAGKFKHLLKGSDEYLQQLEKMKDISGEIKLLESQIKSIISEDPSSTAIQNQQLLTPFFDLTGEADFNEVISTQLTPLHEVSDWQEFVSGNPSSLPSHNPAWQDIIKLSFQHHSLLLSARDINGQLLAGIPVTILTSTLFGRFGVSVPYLNYGGVVSKYPNLHERLIRELADIRVALKLKYIEVRSIYPNLGRVVSMKKSSMILPLPKSDQELEKQLGSKLRAQYRKAESYAPNFAIGKIDLLDDFYSVFSQNMRDLGTPVYHKRWFENILKHPNIAANIVVVYMHGEAVSAGFLIKSGCIMEIPWASTLTSANQFNANMWMYRQILEFAIEQGCEFFDFGRSTHEAGTFKFKKQWGAQPCQHYWYMIADENSPLPQLNPDNPKLKLLIAIWKCLPVWLTRIVGPTIVKGIP